MKKNSVTGVTAVKRYLKKVRSGLSCPRRLKRGMLSDLESNVHIFLEENPSASMEDIVTRFGEPAALSESYLSSLDDGELVKAVSAAKRVRRIVLVVCVVALLLLVATFYKMIRDSESTNVIVIDTSMSEGIID